jgi:hypothetical protein
VTQKKQGRPPGRKTASRPVAEVRLSRCPRCGSTDRIVYGQEGHTLRIDGQGVDADGLPYSAVLLSPTRCRGCNQARFDRRYLFEPDAEAESLEPDSGDADLSVLDGEIVVNEDGE